MQPDPPCNTCPMYTYHAYLYGTCVHLFFSWVWAVQGWKSCPTASHFQWTTKVELQGRPTCSLPIQISLIGLWANTRKKSGTGGTLWRPRVVGKPGLVVPIGSIYVNSQIFVLIIKSVCKSFLNRHLNICCCFLQCIKNIAIPV